MKTNNIISPEESSKLQHKYNDFQENNNRNNDEKQKQKSYNTGTDNKLHQKMQESEIDLTKKISSPPVILKFDNDNLFFLGDFSLTIGKAKSRKTFLGSLLMSILVGNTTTDRITAQLPKNKRTILYFDTEQGAYHAYQSAKRVLRLLGVDQAENFRAFSLRKYSTKERMRIIEYWIYNTPNLGVVFIDGIRDLVTSINDEIQATDVVSKIMKWTSEKQIHINCVLHMNKNDMNARGHLGTELLNKSLVTISVTKNSVINGYSEVVVTESREKEPAPFLFGIDEDGLPFVVPDSDIPKKRKKSVVPQSFELSSHIEILKSQIYSTANELTYAEIKTAVKAAYGIGENKAKDFVRYFVQEKLISGVQHGNRTIYSMV